MAQSYQRSLLIALTALVPALTACERVDEISGVTENSDTRASVVSAHSKPMNAQLVKRSADGSVPTQVAFEYVTPQRKGRLQIGKYMLEIPRGAVRGGTWFRMKVVDNGYITVELDAFDARLQRVTHFMQPLKLTIPYEDGSPDVIDDPAKLKIAHTVDEEILELVGASVNKRTRTVSSPIWHFSMWTLAKEFSPGID